MMKTMLNKLTEVQDSLEDMFKDLLLNVNACPGQDNAFKEKKTDMAEREKLLKDKDSNALQASCAQ